MDGELSGGSWTGKRRAELVLAVLREEISVAEAALEHGLTVAEVEGWCERFLQGAENALREPADPDFEPHDEAIERLHRQIRMLIESIRVLP